jgi:hypothetical protein
MDDIQVIHYLGRALTQAASQSDWSQVQEVDKQIAALLSSLSGTPLSDEKRAALKALQQIHRQVNETCRLESEDLERKMALGRRNREGAVAYAAFMDDEDLR